MLVDDGSTDGTEGALAPYRGRLHYVRQRNRGVAAARNTGIRHARGRMLALLDGDDLWQPDKLQRQGEAADSRPGPGLIVTGGEEVGPDGIMRESLLNPSVV